MPDPTTNTGAGVDPAGQPQPTIPLPGSADVPQEMRERYERPAYDQAEEDELGWCDECGQECGHRGHRHAQGDHGETICEQCGVTLSRVGEGE